MMKRKESFEFVKVGSINTVGSLAVIKSLLESENVTYHITNEHFSSLYGAADGLTMMDILVRSDQVNIAKDLLKDYVE